MVINTERSSGMTQQRRCWPPEPQDLRVGGGCSDRSTQPAILWILSTWRTCVVTCDSTHLCFCPRCVSLLHSPACDFRWGGVDFHTQPWASKSSIQNSPGCPQPIYWQSPECLLYSCCPTPVPRNAWKLCQPHCLAWKTLLDAPISPSLSV